MAKILIVDEEDIAQLVVANSKAAPTVAISQRENKVRLLSESMLLP